MTDPTTSLINPPPSRKSRTALIFFAVTFLVVAAAAAIYAFHQPPVYYAYAMTEPFVGPKGDPAFLQAQVQTIRSPEILYPVIDRLRLTESWGFQRNGKTATKEEAYARLLDALEITPVPASNIIHIGIYARERIDAANVPNMTMIVYHKYLMEKYPASARTSAKAPVPTKMPEVSFRQVANIKNQIAWGAVAGLFLGLLSAAIPLCRK